MLCVILLLLINTCFVYSLECQPGYRVKATCSQWEYQMKYELGLDGGDCQSYHYQCEICPAGTRNSYTSTNQKCYYCESGFFSSAGSANCASCPGGYYDTARASTACKACPAGFFSPLYQHRWGVSSCTQCPSGRYESAVNASVCTGCPAGKYNHLKGSVNITVCEDCNIGRFSAIGAQICSYCPSGYYQNTNGSVSCKGCIAGKFGYFAMATSESDCDLCPAGKNSNLGDTKCYSCYPGYYGVGEGAGCKFCPEGKRSSGGRVGIGSCFNCPAGKFWTHLGVSYVHWDMPEGREISECKTCPYGKRSEEATIDTCDDCSPGMYGKVAGFCSVCEIGRYGDQNGMTSCKLCSAGKFNTLTGKTSEDYCEKCARGRYNDLSGHYECKICPIGRYNNKESSTNISDCEFCELGRFSNGNGAVKCTFCDTGQYQNETGQISCQSCAVGLFNNKKQQVSATVCKECPEGYYNDETATAGCKKCALQTYTDETGQVSCKGCQFPKYADMEAMTTCKEAIYLNILNGLDSNCNLQLSTDESIPRSGLPSKCPPLRLTKHVYDSTMRKVEKEYRYNGIWTDTLCTIKKSGETMKIISGLLERDCKDLKKTTWEPAKCTDGPHFVDDDGSFDNSFYGSFKSYCSDDFKTFTPSRCEYLVNDYQESLSEYECDNLVTTEWVNTFCKHTVGDQRYGLSETQCLNMPRVTLGFSSEHMNPLEITVAGTKINSVPAFVDLDDDGDMDLLVGRGDGDLDYYYENTGSMGNPLYERREGVLNPFDGMQVGGYSAPAFVDLDDDGDMDLVIGSYRYDLKFYYENTGSPTNPSYTRREGALNPFDGVANVGYNSVPTFVDIDNDGDMDLVLGGYSGDLKFYENRGSASNPSYTRRTDHPIDLIDDIGFESAPAFLDIDGDGDMDLVIGRREGDLTYYENTGSPTNPSYTRREGALNRFDGIPDVGAHSVPTFAKINDDPYMDLVIGNQNGDLEYYYENYGIISYGTSCSVKEGDLTYTLSCVDTCTEGEINGGKICHEGHKKNHTCTLNSKDISGCDCFGNTCSLWCLDNGECVDMLEDPNSADLENAFNNGVS